MRSHLLFLATVLLCATSCKLLERPTPQQKLADLVEQHPELAVRDTVRDTVRVEVPRVVFQKVFVPVIDSARTQAERHQLDSLLSRVELRLDSVQRLAVRQRMQQWLASRPVLDDTLCFDTLGVMGRVWRTGTAYQLWLERKAITQDVAREVVVDKLTPCSPCALPLIYAWYDPRGWPWWLLLAAGFSSGVAVCYTLFRLAINAAR